MLTIDNLMNGERFKVERVVLSGEIGKRLADMGFIKGIEGCVVRSALFGDPLQVKILGYDISIRRTEAQGIEVIYVSKGHCRRKRHRGAANETR